MQAFGPRALPAAGTPIAALTCAGVSSEQASAGGAAHAARVAPSAKRMVPRITAKVDLRFISSILLKFSVRFVAGVESSAIQRVTASPELPAREPSPSP